ncbi:MAG: PKD domain-containing protein, partial [Actinomycetota bacterium]
VALGAASGFTASVTGGTNVVYNWDLGDGTLMPDAGPSVSHTYAASGSYTVTVTAVNGVSSDTSSTIGVVNDTPIAGLTASNGGPAAVGSPVTLTAATTAGTNITYDWDFGDGSSATDAGPSVDHTYSAVGSYTATVTATNSAGTETATTTVTVDNVAIAGLSVTPDAALFVNSPANFTASLTAGTAVSYSWNFGDGTVLPNTGSAVSHSYTSAGTYTVTVTATNSVSTETTSVTVTVDDEPAFEELINVGGASYVDSQNRTWDADNSFDGGRGYSRVIPIANTVDDPLYQSERYGNFTYSIAVPANGCYQTSLHFAELWWGGFGGGGDGNRLFDVFIEDTMMLDDFDIHASFGPSTAGILSFDQDVADSTVDIEFVTEADNAKVSAIEIRRVGATCP